MGIKRIASLAVMALAAVALSVPAAASASGTWTDDHDKLRKDGVLKLTGKVTFALPGVFSFGCDVHIEAKLTASYGKGTGVKTGTGHVEKYEATTDTCVGTGLLTGCQLQSDSTTNLPLMLTATKTDIDVVDKAKHHLQFSSCPISSAQLEFGPTTLHLNNAETFSEVEIEGSTESGVLASGTLELGEEEAGTYGVHEPAKPGEEEE